MGKDHHHDGSEYCSLPYDTMVPYDPSLFEQSAKRK